MKTRFNVKYVNNSSQIYRQNEILFSIFLNTSFETANKIFQKTEILLKIFRQNFMYASIADTILLASSNTYLYVHAIFERLKDLNVQKRIKIIFSLSEVHW